MADDPQQETTLLRLLDRHAVGEAGTVEDLVKYAMDRFKLLVRKKLHHQERLRRWTQTDDVLQGVAVRLFRALRDVKPGSQRAFSGLIGTLIRRELCDLNRHFFGPQGDGRNHQTDPGRPDSQGGGQPLHVQAADPASGPASALLWQETHEQVQRLTEEEREVFHLVYYAGLTRAEAARHLGVSEVTVMRRFREARSHLHRILHGTAPDS